MEQKNLEPTQKEADKIRQKLDKITALKEIASYKAKICGQNILDLLESEDVHKEIEEIKPGKYLLAAVIGGFVYWDEKENCLVQHLVMPVESGTQKCNELHYRHNLTFGLLRDESSGSDIATGINVIHRLTGRSKQLIEKLHGQDLAITQDVAGFFYSR